MPHLAYSGGPVLQQVQVVQINYPFTPFATNLSQFYTDITGSAYFDWLAEYDTSSPPQTIGRGQLVSVVNLTSAAPTTTSDAQIQSSLTGLISPDAAAVPTPTANTLYVIHFPSTTTVTLPGGLQSCRDFCQYHGTFSLSGQSVYYAVLPACAGCGGGTQLQNTTATASHALVDAVTDPDGTAWVDPVNGEIGAICNNQQASLTVNGSTYTVQKEWSNAHNACIVTNVVSPTPALSAPAVVALGLLLALSATHRIALHKRPRIVS